MAPGNAGYHNRLILSWEFKRKRSRYGNGFSGTHAANMERKKQNFEEAKLLCEDHLNFLQVFGADTRFQLTMKIG